MSICMSFGRFLFLLLMFVMNQSSFSLEKIDYDCAASFEIVPEKTINLDGENLACGVVDEIRFSAYQSFNKNNINYIVDNIDVSLKEISDLEELLNDNSYKEEHGKLALSTFLKTISAISLANCVPSLGGGCVVSAVSFVGSIYSQFDSLTDYVEKTKELKKLKLRLRIVKEQLGKHSAELPTGYDEAVVKFNSLCNVIKDKCSK